jgi:hypothetical protein
MPWREVSGRSDRRRRDWLQDDRDAGSGDAFAYEQRGYGFNVVGCPAGSERGCRALAAGENPMVTPRMNSLNCAGQLCPERVDCRRYVVR